MRISFYASITGITFYRAHVSSYVIAYLTSRTRCYSVLYDVTSFKMLVVDVGLVNID